MRAALYAAVAAAAPAADGEGFPPPPGPPAPPEPTPSRLPRKMLGTYLLLADNTVKGRTSADDWQPALHPYQQAGFNVHFLTFIDPTDMAVPPAFARLARTRGTSAAGALPNGTVLIFSIGGQAYSEKPNPWPFLKSAAAARAMATEVAGWASKYGADGIDLDIEEGAGGASGAAANMVVFVDALRATAPGFAITQPVYGNPSGNPVPAATAVVDRSWDANGTWKGGAERIGLMVYKGTQSVTRWVSYWGPGHPSYDGYPITATVPLQHIVGGMSGGDASSSAAAAGVVNGDGLGGLMVWYGSVIDAATGQTAIVYDQKNDASSAASPAWAAALQAMQGGRPRA